MDSSRAVFMGRPSHLPAWHHVETFSKGSELEWLEIGKGNAQLALGRQNLASAYIYSNNALNLIFEVFSNKIAFIFVGPLQPALYHIYNTWKTDSSPCLGKRMVCMASDEQD